MPLPDASVILDGVDDSVQTSADAWFNRAGSMDLRADVALNDWAAGSHVPLVDRWGGPTANRQFVLLWTVASRQIRLVWVNDTSTYSVFSTALPWSPTPGERIQLRVTVDAGSGLVSFYSRTDEELDPDTGWTAHGTANTSAGAGKSVTQGVALGGNSSGGNGFMAGSFFGMRWYEGLSSAGTLVANPDFRDGDQTSDGGGTFVDDAGKTYTLLNGAIWGSGSKATSGDAAIQVSGAVPSTGFQVIPSGGGGGGGEWGERIWLGWWNPDDEGYTRGTNTWYSEAMSGQSDGINGTDARFVTADNPNGRCVNLWNYNVDGSHNAGARLNMQGFDDAEAVTPIPHGFPREMPTEGLYEVDILYPEFVDAQDNVFQFKQGRLGIDRVHLWNIGWKTVDGQSRFIIRTRLSGSTWDNNNLTELATLAANVPVNQVFRLGVFRRMATDSTGRYEVYLDGNLIWEFNGPTIASNLTPRDSGNHEWVTSHYLGSHQGTVTPSNSRLIVSNATIRRPS